LALTDLLFTPLTDKINLANFSCGSTADEIDINGFLKDDTWNYQKEGMANTCLFLDEEDNIACFFCISNDCLNDLGIAEDAKNKSWNWFHRKARIPNDKRIKSYPSIKIGRLSVSEKYQCTGLAYQMMDFIKFFSIAELKPACRLLILDAYNKPRQINFYQKNGFNFADPGDEDKNKRLMFFSLYRMSV
jgi:GNAT superfamily N-acetyltransferase